MFNHRLPIASMFLLFSSVCAAFAVGPDDTASQPRTWTSADGKFHTLARLVDVGDKSVVLLKKDGKRVTVPREKLTQDDLEYIASFKTDEIAESQPITTFYSLGGGVAVKRSLEFCPATPENEPTRSVIVLAILTATETRQGVEEVMDRQIVTTFPVTPKAEQLDVILGEDRGRATRLGILGTRRGLELSCP